MRNWEVKKAPRHPRKVLAFSDRTYSQLYFYKRSGTYFIYVRFKKAYRKRFGKTQALITLGPEAMKIVSDAYDRDAYSKGGSWTFEVRTAK